MGLFPQDLGISLLRRSIYLHFVALGFVAGQDLVPVVTSSLLQAVLSYPLVPIRDPPAHSPHAKVLPRLRIPQSKKLTVVPEPKAENRTF